MSKFYTKKGDDGYTSVLSKSRVPKYDHRIETVGAIDEANAAIALARTQCKAPQTSAILFKVQRELYHLMAEVSASIEDAHRFRVINTENVVWLEAETDTISSQVNIPDGFIIPGDSIAGASLDLARTIVRRAERYITRMVHQKELENQEILRYINRLSSLMFVLELLENQVAGISHPTLAKDN